MKKRINITLVIYVIVFLLIALLRLIFNMRVFFYSEFFFNIRAYYRISVIIVLMILRSVIVSKKDTLSKIKYIYANIIIVLALSFAVFYSAVVFCRNENTFENYTHIKNDNTGEEYFVNNSAMLMVRSGYISISKLYYNCLLSEKERIELGCESYGKINEIRWENSDTLILDCVITTHYNGTSENKIFKVNLED